MWQKRCGSSGVAAAAGGSSGAGPAVGGQSDGRACVRAGAQTWRAHLRGYQRGRSGRASGRNRTWFFKGTTLRVERVELRSFESFFVIRRYVVGEFSISHAGA